MYVGLTAFSMGKVFLENDKEKSSCISTETFLPAGASPPGGDDGNRTRVRKPIRMNFYECSLLLTFPRVIGNKHPTMLSSLQYTDGTQALPECVHRWSTPKPKPRYSSAGRAAIKQLLIQNYCCRLILKRCRFKRWHKPLLAYHVSKSPSKPLHPRLEIRWLEDRD